MKFYIVLLCLFLITSKTKCDDLNSKPPLINSTKAIESTISVDLADINEDHDQASSSTLEETSSESSVKESENNSGDETEDFLEKFSEIWSEGEKVKVRKPQDDITVEDSVRVLKRWHQLSGFFVESLVHRSFSTIANLMLELDISTACQTSMLRLVEGLRKQKSWAFKLVDSYGRMSPGFVEGTLTDFGEFRECLNVDIPVSPHGLFKKNDPIDSTGKYCLLQLEFPMPNRPKTKVHFNQPIINLNSSRELEDTVWGDMVAFLNGMYSVQALRLGICIPSTCRADEIESLVKRGLEPLLFMPARVGPESECSVRNEKIHLSKHQQVAMTVYAIMIGLSVLGSLLDFMSSINSKNNESGRIHPIKRLLLCFSLQRNFKKLVHVNPTQHKQPGRADLRCVHGMRVFSMFWIIVGHTYFFGAVYQVCYAVKKLIVDVPRYPGQMIYQPLTNTYLVVDSFFFLGGLVMINVIIPALRKQKGRFNYPLYLLHRFLRMIPSLVGLTAFLFFYPLLSSGPMFKKEVNRFTHVCENTWYYNLLFISNYLWPSEMCAGQVWFTGADFQLYVFAPIVFLTLYKQERLGIWLCSILIVLGGMISALVAYLTETTATFSLDHLVDQEYLLYQSNIAYFPFYQHITTYVSGILVGYLILQRAERTANKQEQRPTNDSIYDSKARYWTIVRAVGWVLAPACSLIFMFCTFYWNSADNYIELPNWLRISLAATQRVGWVTGIAFITFQCATGRGGPVAKLLCWPGLVPFSRLSFSIYLVHLVPIVLRAYSFHYTIPWSDYEFLSMSLMNTLICTFLALCLHLLFEAPFANMEKLLLQRTPRNGSKQVNGLQENENRISSSAQSTLSSPDERKSDSNYSSGLSESDYSKPAKNYRSNKPPTQSQIFQQLSFLPPDVQALARHRWQLHHYPSEQIQEHHFYHYHPNPRKHQEQRL